MTPERSEEIHQECESWRKKSDKLNPYRTLSMVFVISGGMLLILTKQAFFWGMMLSGTALMLILAAYFFLYIDPQWKKSLKKWDEL